MMYIVVSDKPKYSTDELTLSHIISYHIMAK